jgi:hypothetical protein
MLVTLFPWLRGYLDTDGELVLYGPDCAEREANGGVSAAEPPPRNQPLRRLFPGTLCRKPLGLAPWLQINRMSLPRVRADDSLISITPTALEAYESAEESR